MPRSLTLHERRQVVSSRARGLLNTLLAPGTAEGLGLRFDSIYGALQDVLAAAPTAGHESLAALADGLTELEAELAAARPQRPSPLWIPVPPDAEFFSIAFPVLDGVVVWEATRRQLQHLVDGLPRTAVLQRAYVEQHGNWAEWTVAAVTFLLPTCRVFSAADWIGRIGVAARQELYRPSLVRNRPRGVGSAPLEQYLHVGASEFWLTVRVEGADYVTPSVSASAVQAWLCGEGEALDLGRERAPVLRAPRADNWVY